MQQTTLHIPEDLPKTKTFSPDLQQAINRIYLWVKDGCPPHQYFSRYWGLCTNIASISCVGCEEVSALLFGGKAYPFDGSISSYSDCENKYTNPKRLAWLQEHQTVE